MLVRQIVDPQLSQYGYLIGCQSSSEALVVDPERDIDRYRHIAAAEGLRIVAVAETHIHADFLSGAREFAAADPRVTVYVSAEGGPEWRHQWPAVDRVRVTRLRDGDTFRIGQVELRAWYTPGHTPEHLSFLVTDHAAAEAPVAVLSGDFVFVGDLGRPDLLETAAGIAGTIEPAARQLYRSVRAFLELPDYVQVWPGHGAGSACGKALGAVPWTTVGYERRTSPALAVALEDERQFIDFILSGQPEPPFYFARMKHLNTVGPSVVGRLSALPRLDAAALLAAHAADVQVIDTRLDRSAFLHGHLAGSLLAPLDRSFPTIVGSLVDPDTPILLLAAESGVDDARRQLTRIGFDQVQGWAPIEALETLELRPRVVTTESIDFRCLEDTRGVAGTILDVRSAAEYGAHHLTGALNIAHTRLRADWRRLRGPGPLFVHCATGARAAAAAAFLEHHGLATVHVEGGFDTTSTTVPTCVVRRGPN